MMSLLFLEAHPSPFFDIDCFEGIWKTIQIEQSGIVLETPLLKNLNVSILNCPYALLPIKGFVGGRAHNASRFHIAIFWIRLIDQFYLNPMKFSMKVFHFTCHFFHIFFFYPSPNWSWNFLHKSHFVDRIDDADHLVEQTKFILIWIVATFALFEWPPADTLVLQFPYAWVHTVCVFDVIIRS